MTANTNFVSNGINVFKMAHKVAKAFGDKNVHITLYGDNGFVISTVNQNGDAINLHVNSQEKDLVFGASRAGVEDIGSWLVFPLTSLSEHTIPVQDTGTDDTIGFRDAAVVLQQLVDTLDPI